MPPKMRNECSFSELYFPRDLAHPPDWDKRNWGQFRLSPILNSPPNTDLTADQIVKAVKGAAKRSQQ